MIRQYELVERVCSYDPMADEQALNSAYIFAMKAHGEQTRASGDPYFLHPLEVAGILTDMRLDYRTIITALLHDTVEDTSTTIEDINKVFGVEVGGLVDGVTKLTRIELQSNRTKQAENFRKLFVAMAEDIRVLLVKLADRLHNMRTLNFIADVDKRKRIATETMDIYAPLAEQIGVQGIRNELEDLAFRQLNADAYETIERRLETLSRQDTNIIDNIIADLTETCAEAGLDARIEGRTKAPYSVWLKMQRKNVTIEQLPDIVGFRLIVPSEKDCYVALGAIHCKYPALPGRFKDFISTSKPNKYRSLHTGVVGPKGERIEIQIRTEEMHEVAELGVAAHWIYKQGESGARDGMRYRWVREFMSILEHAAGPEEFLEHTKLEMYQDQVFSFTPKGDLIALPNGATPIDFAFAVHSEIGDTCVAAKINGQLCPLKTPLNNGDQVQIEISTNSTPSPEWEEFVVTGKAKAAIRRFVRQKGRQQFVSLGKEVLKKEFRVARISYSEQQIADKLDALQYDNVDDVFFAVGKGNIDEARILRVVCPGYKPLGDTVSDNVVPISCGRKSRKTVDAIALKGLIPGLAVHFARCCHPLPGERIVGIVTTGKGITIHTIDCETLENFQAMPELWRDVTWDMEQVGRIHVSRLEVTLANEPNSLASVCKTVGDNGGNIINLKISNRNLLFFELRLDVEVSSVRHLTTIIAALRTTPVITSVERDQG